MALVFNRRLSIPLWAVASIVVALTAPSVTLSLMMILGMAMIGFTIPGLVPWLRAVPAVARRRSHGTTRARAAAAEDALDLVRMDDDGGWKKARPPA